MPKATSTIHYARPARADPYPLSAPQQLPGQHPSHGHASGGAEPVGPRDLPPERPSTAWSAEDDRQLMQFRQQGLNWGPIAEHFPGKTPNACRKRHERLMERKNTSEWDTIRTEDLAAAYFECREHMWRVLADHLGEPKWQTLESKCMEKGFKNLQTAARGARRGSARYGSPQSHPSDEAFDDSGLALDGGAGGSSRQHTPPQPAVLLPPPSTQRDSPSSRTSPGAVPSQGGHHSSSAAATAAAVFNFTSATANTAGTGYEARPPVLAGPNPYATYSTYATGGYGYGAATTATTGAAWSGAGAASSSAPATSLSQRLPSLSQELNFLPPVNHFGGRMGGHIATSTYG